MKKNNFHLIGIGGIGMSALAHLLLAQKYTVSGSDPSQSDILVGLSAKGASIFEGHHAQNIEAKETTVVYSTAIAETNPEIVQARSLGCNLWHRSDLLAHLMHPYQSIAITGTHGKTTTSALVSHVLMVANQSPSFMIGGLLRPQNINGLAGDGKYFVAEADESDKSFLKYFPHYSIITNVEADHLDHYRDLEEIKDSFKQFITQVKTSLVWCYDCKTLQEISPKGISYGFHEKADIRITRAEQKGFKCSFDLCILGKDYLNIELPMIGKHNVLNGAAVFGLALKIGIDEAFIRQGLASFSGVKRRAEKIGEHHNIQIFDDYAHHPTELRCMLKSFKEAFPKRRVIALFQPHRYSRLLPFQEEFAHSFEDADEVWLTDVYAAGETFSGEFSIKNLACQVEKASKTKTHYVAKKELLNFFSKEIRPFDVLITVGAGDITSFGKEALKELQAKGSTLKLAMICGSISYEHYVSLFSSRFIIENYNADFMELKIFRILPTGQWTICDKQLNSIQNLTMIEVVQELQECDVVLPVLHGRCGEDGMIQGFLTALQVAYCGTSYSQSALNMNKIWMKLFVEQLKIPVPKGLDFSKEEWLSDLPNCLTEIEKKLPFPIVVKPASSGSTLGVSFVNNKVDLIKAIEDVFAMDTQVVIEEQIFGKDLEVSCFETEEGLVITHPGEVRSDVREYNYVAKYSQNPIEKIVRANISTELAESCRALAKKIYCAMQIKSYTRIDFFLTQDGQLIFAEVNTHPGMTPRSLFQRTLISHGIEAKEVINQMVIDAMYRRRQDYKKSLQIGQYLELIKDVTHAKKT